MTSPEIVVYHYTNSPVARRLIWYLTLRGLPYTECMQASLLPRPDITDLLGIGYRRIPVMGLGKSIICDSRLMIKKLESQFPSNRLLTNESDYALSTFLEMWTMETLFPHAVKLLPWRALARDPAFLADRQQMSGAPFRVEDMEKARPEAVAALCVAFAFAEKNLLGHGKDWILANSDTPSLLDVQAVWVFDWLMSIPPCLKGTPMTKENFPRVFAYVERFRKARGTPKALRQVSGKEAKRIIENGVEQRSIGVLASDPLGLKEGDYVNITPTDSAKLNPTMGRLIGLSFDEVVIEVQSGLPVHFPRIGFSIRKSSQGKL